MRARLSSLREDTRGVAAMEFAIIVPIMVLLLVAIYQIANLVRVNMKLSNVAVAVADMVAQQASGVSGGTSGTLGNYCKAAQLMMAPFPTVNGSSPAFSLAIASVTNYSNGTSSGTVKLDWEVDAACALTASPLGSNAITLSTSPVNLLPNSGGGAGQPSGIAGDSVIVVQVNYAYSYQNLTQAALISTSQSKIGFSRPRANTVIKCTSACS